MSTVIFATRLDDQAASLQERSCSVCFALSAREEIRVVAGEIVAEKKAKKKNKKKKQI